MDAENTKTGNGGTDKATGGTIGTDVIKKDGEAAGSAKPILSAAPETVAKAEPVGAGSGQTPYSAGYALKVTVDNHTHAGVTIKKGATIALDIAEYRYALEHKLGVPGSMEDVGYDVDAEGNAIKPENEKSLADLEAAAIKANQEAETKTEAETTA